MPGKAVLARITTNYRIGYYGLGPYSANREFAIRNENIENLQFPLFNQLMLRQAQHELRISTRGRALYEITDQIERWLSAQSASTGLLTLHLRHTSASLLIQENADPDVRRDLEAFFSRLVPDGDRIFIHNAEGEDDMPAHIRTTLTAVNLSIPVADGRMVLGTWQGIYLWEHRKAPHSRSIILHLIGGP